MIVCINRICGVGVFSGYVDRAGCNLASSHLLMPPRGLATGSGGGW